MVMVNNITHEGAAALAAETRKHAANDARCQALGWSCIPLAVETFGNWGREAQGVFSRLTTLLALHQGRSKSTVVRDILWSPQHLSGKVSG